MLIEKEKLPLVAMDFMNAVHFEDADLINQLYQTIIACEQSLSLENEQALEEVFQAWYNHTVEHFANEEKQMQEKQFPPFPIHKSEHDQSLKQMRQVWQYWEKEKDIPFLKKYLEDYVSQWLVQHIQTMDTMTALYLKQKS